MSMRNYFDRNPVLLYFGRKIVEELLNKPIDEFLSALSDPKWDLLQEKLICYSQEQIDVLKKELIPYIVTCTVSDMLCFFEQNEEDIQLIVNFEGEQFNIVEVSDGLYGDFNGSDGWIDRFAKYTDFITRERRKEEKKIIEKAKINRDKRKEIY